LRAVAREAGPARQAGGRPPGGGRQRTLSFWMMVVTGLPVPFAAGGAVCVTAGGGYDGGVMTR